MTAGFHGCVHPARRGESLKCRNTGVVLTRWGYMCRHHARQSGVIVSDN